MLIATYVLVADRLDQAAHTAKFERTRGPEPDYDATQIITIALAADYWFDGDEEKEDFVWERGKHLLLPLRRDNQ
jgi:hypothetical protein